MPEEVPRTVQRARKTIIFHVIFLEIVCHVCRRVEESRNEHGEEEADDWKFQEEKVCEFKGHATRENSNIYLPQIPMNRQRCCE